MNSDDDFETAIRDFERGDTRPSSHLGCCLEAGCSEDAVGRCEDCREEYCDEHLAVIPGFVTSRACPACLAARFAESGPLADKRFEEEAA